MEKCIKFLLNNGYTEAESNSEYKTFEHTSSAVSWMDVSKDEIVFISDDGDWLHIPCNYYALIGALIHYSQIGVGYIRENG